MSTKEIELIEFLNKKLDELVSSNDKVRESNNNCIQTDLSVRLCNAWLTGYDCCVRDIKRVILKLLKGEIVVYDEKESS